MITAALIVSAMLIPLVSVLFLRLYENQLVRQAEGELIGQSAILASAYERAIAGAGERFSGRTVASAARSGRRRR